MPSPPRLHLLHAEVLAALKKLAATRGEALTLPEFCKHLGVSQSTLLRRFGRWKDLRAAAGLRQPRAPLPAQYSDDTLIREYIRICRQLGRPPREREFNRRSQFSYRTLQNRFGSDADIERRARVVADYEETFGPRPPGDSKPKLPWDEAWLRELWTRVRVAFALYSSNLRPHFSESSPSPPNACALQSKIQNPQSKIPSSPPDIIFCAVHDWPGCPVPVLVAPHILGDRARQPPPPNP